MGRGTKQLPPRSDKIIQRFFDPSTTNVKTDSRVIEDSANRGLQPVQSGRSYNFNGTSDGVVVPHNNLLNFGDSVTDSAFTITSWINMVDATRFRIFNKGEIIANTIEYQFAFDVNDQLRLILFDNDTTNRIDAITNETFTARQGEDLFLAATNNGDGTLNGITLYAYLSNKINQITTPRIDTTQGTYVAMHNEGGVLKIGHDDNNFFSNGKIWDVRVHNKELTQTEVESVRDGNASGAEVGWWKGDEQTGLIAYDSSGNGLDGDIILVDSSATTINTFHSTQSLYSFQNKVGYNPLLYGNSTEFTLSGSSVTVPTGFTVLIDFAPVATGATGNDGVFHIDDTTSFLHWNKTNNELEWVITTSPELTTSSLNLQKGDRVQAALKWVPNGPNYDVSFFVNGAIVDQNLLVAAPQYVGSSKQYILTQSSGDNVEYYSHAVYHEALSDADIISLQTVARNSLDYTQYGTNSLQYYMVDHSVVEVEMTGVTNNTAKLFLPKNESTGVTANKDVKGDLLLFDKSAKLNLITQNANAYTPNGTDSFTTLNDLIQLKKTDRWKFRVGVKGFSPSGFDAVMGSQPLITLVYSNATAASNGNDINFNLTGNGVTTNDIVILYGSSTDSTPFGPSQTGYTLLYLHGDGESFGVWYKIMGTSTDSNVTGQGGGPAQDGCAYGIHVLRGIDQSNPIDVSPTVSSGDGASTNLDGVTTKNDYCWVLAIAAKATDTGPASAPAGYINFRTAGVLESNGRRSVAVATKEVPVAGLENPGAFSFWDGPTQTWQGITLAIRPGI